MPSTPIDKQDSTMKTALLSLYSFIVTLCIAVSMNFSVIPAPRPPEFVLFTMPKTGTHLLRPFLEQLTHRKSIPFWSQEIKFPKEYLYDTSVVQALLAEPDHLQIYWLHRPTTKNAVISLLNSLKNHNAFLVTHAPFSPLMESLLAQRHTVVFFVVRDPRDWVVSVVDHPAVPGVDFFGDPLGDRTFVEMPRDKKIETVITGMNTNKGSFPSGEQVVSRFLPWKDSNRCCLLKFETLLGPRGGASSILEQLIELRKISDALNLDVSDDLLLSAFENSFGKGTTFNKGKTGVWKTTFNEHHKALFKQHMGKILIALGYEQDDNW